MNISPSTDYNITLNPTSSCCAVLSYSVMPNSLGPHGVNPQDFSVHGDSPSKNTGMGFHALFQGIFPTPGTEPRSPTMQVDSLPSELPEKLKNTGVGSLSLLQGILLT